LILKLTYWRFKVAQTIFADISRYQVPVNNSYPYKFISFRSNDGTYKDSNFQTNLAWAKAAADSGRIAGFIVYFVWRSDWQSAINTLKSQVGTPHPKMAVMIDVESWSGQISGNHSTSINATRESLIKWLAGNRKRVIGYGNYYDLTSIWPSRGDTQIIIANYSQEVSFPNKIAQQFSYTYYIPPFGKCDANLFNGTAEELATILGLTKYVPVPDTPVPDSNNVTELGEGMYLILKNSETGDIALCGANVWQGLSYGDSPVSSADIQVLLNLPLCDNPKNSSGQKAVMLVSPARMRILKQKVAGK